MSEELTGRLEGLRTREDDKRVYTNFGYRTYRREKRRGVRVRSLSVVRHGEVRGGELKGSVV